MKLTGYILTTTARRIAVSTVIVIAVMQILDLLDITNDILERGLGIEGVARYALLRLPRFIERAAPLGALAGSIFAFGQLARENAAVAMRATGLSIYGLAARAAPAAVGLMLIHFTAAQIIAPHTDAMLQSWWAKTTPAAERKAPKPRAFRIGADLVVATPDAQDTSLLNDVTLYRRDAAGRLIERMEAPTARYVDHVWRLASPRVLRVHNGAVQTSSGDQADWTGALTPQDVGQVLSSDGTPSVSAARRALTGGAAERPPSFYAMQVQSAFAGPAGALVMLLLAAPILAVNFRTGRGAVVTAACLMAGLIYMVTAGLFTALGEGGDVAPWLAAWAAPLIFAAGGVTVLLHQEG